jgi:hypothetical protein
MTIRKTININKIILDVGFYSLEGPNQSKLHASCSPEIDLVDLRSLRFYSKYLTTDRQQRRNREEGHTEIHPGEHMASWIYDEKFMTGM